MINEKFLEALFKAYISQIISTLEANTGGTIDGAVGLLNASEDLINPATQETAEAILAKLTADPATQTTLAAILAALPTGYATETTLQLLKTIPMVWGEAYTSPNDFAVAYTSAVTLTISGAPFTVDDANNYTSIILVKNASGIWTKYINGHNGVSITASANVVTIVGAGASPFLNTDLTYRVVVVGQKKAYDPTIDVDKVAEISPLWNRYTDAEGLVTTAQNVTASWADLGAEIDCRGYTRLVVWLTITHNNSVDNRIKALAKHTAAGADEYELPIKTVGSSVVNVLSNYYEFDSDTTQKIVLDFDVSAVPYVQLQIQCATVGSTADTFVATITKMY